MEKSVITLCAALVKAKQEEDVAKRKRVTLENEIDKYYARPGDIEGTKTIGVNGFKITIIRKLTRSLDHEAYLAMGVNPMNTFVNYKPTIDLKMLKVFEITSPVMIASCVTSKPAKTAVKVEVVE